MRKWFVIPIILSVSLTAFACGADDSYGDDGGEPTAAASSGERLTIVTTVAPITSLAENIVGSHADVIGIVPEGTNSHTFEPAPSDAEAISKADVIFANGLRLELPTVALAEANKQEDTEIIALGDRTVTEGEWKFDFSFPESEGDPNPHLWPNVAMAINYATIMHQEIAKLDPANQVAYNQNFAELQRRLEALDGSITEAALTVPEANRKLLTYHDSWAYWADRYGFTIVGAVQPSDFSEPSASDIASLIDQVEEENIPAIFGSEVFPSDALEAIAAESGAEYIDDLRDDDLPGEPGGDRHTYIGLMVTNMEIMLPALGGNTDALAGIETDLVFDEESTAEYPQ